MCVCVCLYVEPVSRSKDYVQSLTEIGSVVCLYIPVSPSVRETEAILLYMPLGASLFLVFFGGCAFGGVYVPCIYSQANWSSRRQFRSLLLCPMFVERYYFPSLVDLRCALLKTDV